jgi:quercetin dioxygenase-like cupin family protein
LSVTQWVDVGPSTRRRIHADGQQLMVVEVSFGAGVVVPEHRHPHEQVTYVVRGAIKFVTDGGELLLNGGDSVYVPANALHAASIIEDSIVLEAFSPPREDLR